MTAARKVKKMFVEVEEEQPQGIVVAVFGDHEIRFLEEEFQATDEAGKKRYQAARRRLGEFLRDMRQFYLDGTQHDRSPFKLQNLYAAADACKELWEKELCKIPAQKLLKQVTDPDGGPIDLAAYVAEYQKKRWKPTGDLKVRGEDPERREKRERAAAQAVSGDTLFELDDFEDAPAGDE